MSDQLQVVDLSAQQIKAQHAEIKRLRERIEELEEENRICDEAYEAFKANPHPNIIITNEMIDEAVEWTKQWLAEDTLWRLLNKLGIFKCEECGGSGHLSPDFDYMVDDTCPDCAKWGSKGWVVKDG